VPSKANRVHTTTTAAARSTTPLPHRTHQSGSGVTAAATPRPRGAGAGAEPPMDLPPLSHQALFAAVRSADAAAVRALLADAEAPGSGTSLAALAAAQTDAGETALYVAAEAGSEEVVRLLLPLYDFEAATVRSRLDLDAFHIAAKQGHTGELPFDPPFCVLVLWERIDGSGPVNWELLYSISRLSAGIHLPFMDGAGRTLCCLQVILDRLDPCIIQLV